MRQGSFQHVGDDFHVAMRVSRKTRAGSHSIFIDDSEIAVAHVFRVIIIAEREGVTAVEPVKFRSSPLIAWVYGYRFASLECFDSVFLVEPFRSREYALSFLLFSDQMWAFLLLGCGRSFHYYAQTGLSSPPCIFEMALLS
jgi:hypothetical protein